jgi:peptide/nickel transport system permease protein
LIFIMRRVLQYGLVLFAVLSINFALPRLAPGDPAYFLVGEALQDMTPEEIQQVLSEFGLNRPVLEQYWSYLWGIVRGEWGTSLRFGKPTTEVLLERVPWTLLLSGSALGLSSLFGVMTGVVAAWKRGRRQDVGILSLVMFLDSMPPFWVAMLLISLFSVTLGFLPAFGAVPIGATGDAAYVVGVAKRLVLPVATLALAQIGSVFLISRYSMLTALGEDYMVTAEAKGVGEVGLVFRHALRNAILPIYTNATLSLGVLLSGAVVVETVFSYPGLGQLIFESVLARDFNLLQGAFLLVSVGVVAANLLADLTYPLIDPRVRRLGALG